MNPGNDGRRSGTGGRTRLGGAAGVLLLVGFSAVGALFDGLTGGGPGLGLSVCTVLGSVLAAMSTGPRSMWQVIPMPPLVFAVMAIAAGVVGDHNATTSTTRLAAAAAAWVAKGFVGMAAATLLAVMVIVVRAANRRL